MATWGYLLIVAVAAVIVSPLVLALIRFNLKRRAVAQSVRNASAEQLDAIYRIIETAAGEAPGACLLVRSNEAAPSNRNIVALPTWLPGFRWAGKHLEIKGDLKNSPDVALTGATDETRSTLGGKTYRPLRLPKRRSKSGKSARNIYAPSALLRALPDLKPALSAICPQHPDDALTYLLGPGSESYEYEPIDQCRIASGVAWIQEPEVPNCTHCNARMVFIAQIPGIMLSPRLGESSFYIFGCPVHDTNLSCVEQYF